LQFTLIDDELSQLRLKVVQLEAQLKETLTELRTVKLRNEELESKLLDQNSNNSSIRQSLSLSKSDREDEETTIELQYDPGPGPFIDFAPPDNDTNILFTEGKYLRKKYPKII
jgi:chromosome segregation ATPase